MEAGWEAGGYNGQASKGESHMGVRGHKDTCPCPLVFCFCGEREEQTRCVYGGAAVLGDQPGFG